jgi:ABC-type Mn2+/Zn2+ transport system ATPase subunit
MGCEVSRAGDDLDPRGPALSVRGLLVRRRKVPVLGPLDLEIGRGELWGVVGPNGAGKTTLLRAIAGLEPADAGSIAIAGRPAGAGTRGVVGWLSQQSDQPPEVPFTVAEVASFARPGSRAAEDRSAVMEALEALGLTGLSERRYRELSGGERRKVELARLLAGRAELLLLDEPAAGLDLDWQERMTALVGDLARRHGRTVVMVSHDTGRLPAGCDGVLLLDRGRAIACGPPRKVLTGGHLSSVFGVPLEVTERGGRFFAGVAT